MANIHATAIVSARAQIATDVEIGPYSVIDDGVVIGSGCRIAAGVRLHSGVHLEEGVQIYHAAAIGGEPQDLKFGGEETTVSVGSHTVIREFVTVSRGTKATGRTIIGKDCMLMAYAHVAHDCVLGDNIILANSVNIAGHVEIEDYAIIGGVVPIHQFVHIGRHSMIGGGFRVPKDVPPYILAAGYPLRYCGLNVVGLRRRGFSTEARANLKRAYQWLFSSRIPMSQAVERIRTEMADCEEIRILLEFIARSKRGLLPGRSFAGGDEEL
ncbi:acyl-ACP--UDP-N-acetylglucosamine O-acyltransferase [bacterium]|nr:acyl-ACP--UDP-N-acetylglucosamine O-acyltransferase [bacterium]MBU1982868.1 acyl-ACP--UDP-N-acetylglucosamine O-acyltransferase [bacterium]